MTQSETQIFSQTQLKIISKNTIGHYNREAKDFWLGTKDHDVSQNYTALLASISATPPFNLLDFGCGPGRDLIYFKSRGHNVIGLDGSEEFVNMARSISGCKVLHQDFLTLKLPNNYFDGVFANAALFHIPRQELPNILRKINLSLKSDGILFSSNPRGDNNEDDGGDRYCCFYKAETWSNYVSEAGFKAVHSYLRPKGLPQHQQPWLATVWKKN